MIRVVLALLACLLIASAAPLHGRTSAPRHIRSFDCEPPKGRIPLPAAVATT